MRKTRFSLSSPSLAHLLSSRCCSMSWSCLCHPWGSPCIIPFAWCYHRNKSRWKKPRSRFNPVQSWQGRWSEGSGEHSRAWILFFAKFQPGTPSFVLLLPPCLLCCGLSIFGILQRFLVGSTMDFPSADTPCARDGLCGSRSCVWLLVLKHFPLLELAKLECDFLQNLIFLFFLIFA